MKRLLALFCVLWTFESANAQQIANSNFFNYNLYLLNPAHAGVNNLLEGSLSHRIQWVGVNGAPVSNFLGVHGRVGQHFGVGAKIVYDKTDILNRMSGSFSLAYHLKLNEAHRIGFGASAGLIQNSIQLSDAVVFDPQDEVATSGNLSESAFTLDAGLVYGWKQLKLGVSFQQLPQTDVVYELPSASGRFELNRHYNGFARYDHTLNDRLHIIPTALFRTNDGGPAQADLIAELEWNKRLRFGAGYRTSAGVITQVGLHLFERLIAAYSYEFSTSGIAGFSSGSHEFMLGFSFARPSKKEAPKVEEMAALPAEVVPAEEKPVVVDTTAQEFAIVPEQPQDPAEEVAPIKEEETVANEESSVLNKAEEETIANEEAVLEEAQEEITLVVLEPEQPQALTFLDQVVLFDLDETELTADSQKALAEIAAELKETPSQRIKVVGHTCNLGGDEVNAVISQLRAKNVSAFLIQAGVEPSQITTEARLDREPVAPNDSLANRRKNRRVSFESY